MPRGWQLDPIGRTTFGFVRPGEAVMATFLMTPPLDALNASDVVHATATMGAATRENGVTVTVG